MEEAPRWPNDPHGYIFLARAIDALGRQLWKADWSGHEVVWGGRTIVTGFGDWMLRSMRDLPASHPQKAFADKWLRGGGDNFLKLWKVAEAELEGDPGAARAAAAGEMLRRVERTMTALLECGALTSYGRPLIGGALSLVSRDWWRSETLSNRWSSFQVDMWHPFGASAGQRDLHWIFIERASLDYVLQEVEGARITNAASAPELAVRKLAGRPGAETIWMKNALRKLYPAGDPIMSGSQTRQRLLEEVRAEAGQPGGSLNSLDRARADAWTSGNN